MYFLRLTNCWLGGLGLGIKKYSADKQLSIFNIVKWGYGLFPLDFNC